MLVFIVVVEPHYIHKTFADENINGCNDSTTTTLDRASFKMTTFTKRTELFIAKFSSDADHKSEAVSDVLLELGRLFQG